MSGQDQENAFFYNQNRELIDQRRALLDRVRETTKGEFASATHWMTCPKCGGKMVEAQACKIVFEQCENCNGVYFDAEEFKTLLQATEHKSFFEHVEESLLPNEKWLADL